MATIQDIESWLGDFAGETSEDTKHEIARAWDQIRETHLPEAREETDQITEEMRDAAGMYLLGDTTIMKKRRDYQRAQRAAALELDELKGVMIAADAHGESIAHIAREAGVTRATAYKWLGRV